MIVTACGGTDAANIVLFWPDNLPDDGDTRLASDPIEFARALQKAGKLIWFPCDGDGGYSVAIYVDAAVPEELLAFCEEVETYPMVHVRSVGYFGGMEYMFKRDSRLALRYPGEFEKVSLPERAYAATVYCTDVPEIAYESWLKDRVGPSSKRLWELHAAIGCCSAISVIASLACIFFLSWRHWSYVVGTAVLLSVSAILLSRTRAYKRFSAAQEEVARVYPTYVVQLTAAGP